MSGDMVISAADLFLIMDTLKQNTHCKSTGQVYHGIWNKFLLRLDSWPPTWEEKTALYVTFLIKCGLQSATIKSYISAIKASLNLIDYEWDNSAAKLAALTKACRLKNDQHKARLPISKKLLELLLFEIERKFSQNQPYLELLYKTIFLVAYHGLLRIV